MLAEFVHDFYCTSLSSLYIIQVIIMSCLQDGVTALGMASQSGHQEVVRLLLQSGARDMPANVRIFRYAV